MNLIQTAGISVLVLIIGGWLYTRCHGDGVRILTKLLLLVNALLLFVDKGSDHERIFILMREPFFHIIDQGKMMQLTKELPN